MGAFGDHTLECIRAGPIASLAKIVERGACDSWLATLARGPAGCRYDLHQAPCSLRRAAARR